MIINLENLSNPGWSFTPTYQDHILSLFQLIDDQSKEKIFDYNEIQYQLSSKYGNLNDSKIRMLFPWLHYFGMLNDYNQPITYGELITPVLGQAYKSYLEIRQQIYSEEKKTDLTEEVISELMKISESFVFEFYKNALSSPKKDIYIYIVLAVKELGSLNEEEFLICLHAVRKELGISWSLELINKLREGDSGILINKVKNSNAFSYFGRFFEQAGILSRGDKDLYPNFDVNFEKAIEVIDIE